MLEQANVNKPHKDLFDREILPRMPWHDITFCVSGAAAMDTAKHFAQRWDNHQKTQDSESMFTFQDSESDDETTALRDGAESGRWYDCCCKCDHETCFCCTCGDRSAVVSNEVLLCKRDVITTQPIPGMSKPWESFDVKAQV